MVWYVMMEAIIVTLCDLGCILWYVMGWWCANVWRVSVCSCVCGRMIVCVMLSCSCVVVVVYICDVVMSCDCMCLMMFVHVCMFACMCSYLMCDMI